MNEILKQAFDRVSSRSLTPQSFDGTGFLTVLECDIKVILKAVEPLLSEVGLVDERLAKYNELLFAVGRKYPDETRHETALKYIRRAESVTSTLHATATHPKRSGRL